MKITRNTNINHIIVTFSDHRNAISIDIVPSKAKVGIVSWFFINAFLHKSIFSYKKVSFSV